MIDLNPRPGTPMTTATKTFWIIFVASLCIGPILFFQVSFRRGTTMGRETMEEVYGLAAANRYDEIQGKGLARPDCVQWLKDMEARYGRIQSWRITMVNTDLSGHVWPGHSIIKWDRLEAAQDLQGMDHQIETLGLAWSLPEPRSDPSGVLESKSQVRERAREVLHQIDDGFEIRRIVSVRRAAGWLVTCDSTSGIRYLALDDQGSILQYLRARIADYPQDVRERLMR